MQKCKQLKEFHLKCFSVYSEYKMSSKEFDEVFNQKLPKAKESVEGIILILSCQKHKNTRLKEFSLPKKYYSGWKVIYVIGDFFLKQKYTLENDILMVQCEDSYLHLLKKFGFVKPDGTTVNPKMKNPPKRARIEIPAHKF